MTERAGSRKGRTAIGCLSLVAAIASAGYLVGCLGSGDDNLVPPPKSDGGDARAGDGSTSDSPMDGPRDATQATDSGSPDVTVQDTGSPVDATVQDRAEATAPPGSSDAGHPSTVFSSTSIDFGAVACGTGTGPSAPATQKLAIVNNGNAALTISATTIGSAFGVSPSSLTVVSGGSGSLTVTATIPTTATAGATLSGSLNIFTNDPKSASVSIHLTATPSGASLALAGGSAIIPPSTIAFPTTSINKAAAPVTFIIRNIGNAPASFTLGQPSDSQFFLSALPAGGVTLNGGDLWTETAGFTPSTGSAASATSAIVITGVTCGAANLSSIGLTGEGTTGAVSGWPTSTANAPPTIQFGTAYCGGAAPPPPLPPLVLQNAGTVDAHITSVAGPDAGFTTDVVPNTAGSVIPAGGSLTIHFTAPPVPAPTPTKSIDVSKAISSQVTFHVDADPASTNHTITLTEQPTGAILGFDTNAATCTAAPSTGTFGLFQPVPLLGTPETQSFCVSNTGSGPPATVYLSATVPSAPADAASQQPFQVASPLTVTPGQQPEPTGTLTFSPVAVGAVQGSLAMSVAAPDPDAGAGYLCAPLPNSIPLSGTGTGAASSIAPTTLSFNPDCGGGAPASQTITVRNVSNPTTGNLDFTWTMTGVTGTGAGQYMVTAGPSSVSATPQPGVLHPGESSTVTVAAAKVPSGVTDPAALAAQFTITTDVPNDTHLISLSEIPMGDQIIVSPGSLGFSEVPVNTLTQPQTLTFTNNANAGSAQLTLTLQSSDGGPIAYTLSTPQVTVPAGGTGTASVRFQPPAALNYPATVAITTTNALCKPLPSPIQLLGTGTAGHVSVSTSQLTFGTDPNDASGLVNCGATGSTRTFTVSNTLASVGNQAFTFTGLSVGKGAASPFSAPVVTAVNGNPPTAALPTLQPGDIATITVTPKAIPQTVDSTTVNDASASAAYRDVLTVTTNVPGDAPHMITLVMQPRGTIITGTPMLTTTWNFQTVAANAISTITSALVNTGNAAAQVSLTGVGQPTVAQPTIFRLQTDPTPVAANANSSIVAEFIPPSASGQWSDQGVLVLTSQQAFCATPPAPWVAVQGSPTKWQTPNIPMTGSSN
jgi:hypothetical protein